MKKRTGLALAGGILEIIAGTYLLIYALWALSFYLQIPNGLQIYNWEMLIVFGVLIFFGIMAIIGKTKKDLATYGILNLLYVGMLIFRAIQTNATNVIWVFSFEMILLVIASMFFFFSKKSEYEIVYEERLKEYKAKEPQEHKKNKNIFTWLSALIVVLMGLSMFLWRIGIIIGLVAIIGFIVMIILIPKKDKSEYSWNANIIFSSIAIFICFVCSIFVPAGFYSEISVNVNTSIITYPLMQDTYIYYNNESNKYEILMAEQYTEYDEHNNEIQTTIYFVDGKEPYEELPSGANIVLDKLNYYEPSTESRLIAYSFHDNKLGRVRFYSELGIVYDTLPQPKISKTQTTDKTIFYMISVVGAIIGLIIILCTKNAQLGIEINKQLKEEERKKTYDKYQNKN